MTPSGVLLLVSASSYICACQPPLAAPLIEVPICHSVPPSSPETVPIQVSLASPPIVLVWFSFTVQPGSEVPSLSRNPSIVPSRDEVSLNFAVREAAAVKWP